MSRLSKHISILIMPTDICNMNCVYCFHNSHHEKEGKMSLKTLKRFYDITLNEYQDVTFIWHGGEPLTMGVDFFQKAIAMQKAYLDVKIQNRMQSNLTLLTDDLADFIKQNKIGVGTSLDGVLSEELRGNTELILKNREKLLCRDLSCGFIMVLSATNVDTLISSYEMFKKLNANYNINPYVATPTEFNKNLLLNPDYTAEKLIEFYNYWVNDVSCNIQVGYFDRMLKFIFYGQKNVCKYNSCLGKWVGLRYNGELVPCNRYFPSEYSYGNVWDYEKISDVFDSDGFKNLLSQAIERRNKCKKNCPIFNFCSGGCNNVALNENGISNNMGTSCRVTIVVYQYILATLNQYKDALGNFVFKNPQIQKIITKKASHSTENHYDVHHDTRI